MISDNYDYIMKKVENSLKNTNRELDDITVVGVTKTVSVEKILELYNCGLKTFGENKVQELLPKIEALPNDISWHFIGNLQSNKVKQIVGKVSLIQSVASYKLLDEINKCCEKLSITQDILIEINIGNEESKCGINEDNLPEYIEYIKNLKNIKCLGIMCIPPNYEGSVDYFKKMRKVFIDNMQKNSHNVYMNVLSMGMSSDYDIAILEGSNMVRIGQAFFGKRM